MAEKPSSAPKPNEKLVRVFDSEQEAEAIVVRGLLDSAGIDSDIVGENSPDVLPVGAVAVLVREEDAARARQLLADYERSPEEERAEDQALEEAALEGGAEVSTEDEERES
jgi:putative signal transducing protein